VIGDHVSAFVFN